MFQPVIKWTGSKRSQTAEIIRHFPKRIKCYYEPFLGGGSMMRACMESDIKVDEYRCSDINTDLIRLWQDIRTQPEWLATRYEQLWNMLTGKDDDKARKIAFYNGVRERFNRGRDTADFLFLLRTCANGMPRYNSNGDFNTSFHITRNGIHPDTMLKLLMEWNRLLAQHNVTFTACSYDTIRTEPDDFLYLDPPYAGTKGIYYGTIDYESFFRWMERQQGGYVLSFDGRCKEKDYTYDIPKKLYEQHVYIRSGNSSFRRVTGKSCDSIVYESLYIKKKDGKRRNIE